VDTTRVDRWVWAIRLYKTRSDATDACRGGHVKVNGKSAKPAAPVRVGAAVAATCFIDHTPPPAPVDRTKVAERERGAGRPTKRDRRRLDDWRAR
jgi:ribosome-associated heat shock protein Hsp15